MIIVRIILLGLLIYGGIKLISRVVRLLGATRDEGPGDPAPRRLDADNMVRDPVCGMYLSVRDAIRLDMRGGTLYFCSEKCRRRYTHDKE